MDLTKPNQNITYKVGATNFELQRAIEAALPAAVAQTKDLAKKFKGSTEKETCSKIFNFLMSDIKYIVDNDNQKIKLPSAFLREKTGDCKSYALFTAAILSNLKIPFNFTYASYNPTDKTPEHIYVTTKKGCIIDAVWGKFNSEKKACYKFQKPMNISYISGVKKHHSSSNNDSNQSYYIEFLNKNKGFKKDRKEFSDYEKAVSYGKKNLDNFNMDMVKMQFKKIGNMPCYNNIGTVLQPAKFSGIGRTGLDWGNAVGRNFTAGEVAEYLSKNAALAPARAILLMFIRNNGGGIASFLYSMAFRPVPYELPNNKKYNDEYAAGTNAIDEKYKYQVWVWPSDAVKRYQDAYALFMANNPNGTFTKKMVDFLTPAQLQQYNLSKLSNAELIALKQPLIKALTDSLAKKYPLSTRFLPVATDASKARYRAIEWKWFWNLGGSPDDLNEAVKEGNTKSARGLDANYMLNKAYNGGLSIADLGLVIRGIVSAEAGDKFGLGDEGTYVVAINGPKRIGDAATTAAAITAYSAAIIPIISYIMSEIRKSTPEQIDPSYPTPTPTGGVTDILSGNTGILLLAAAGVGAYLYLK